MDSPSKLKQLEQGMSSLPRSFFSPKQTKPSVAGTFNSNSISVSKPEQEKIQPTAERPRRKITGLVNSMKGDGKGTGTFSKSSDGQFSKDRRTESRGGSNRGKPMTSKLKSLGFRTSKNATLNFYDQWKMQHPAESLTEILIHLLNGLNLEENAKMNEFADTFYEIISKKIDEKPSHLFNLPQIQELQAIPELIQNFFGNQKRIANVVKAQSHIRRFIERKRYMSLFKEEPGVAISETKMYQRLISLRDLIKFEEDYINNLDTIVSDYLNPLKRFTNRRNSVLGSFSQNVSISKEDVNSIFGNVESLLQVHMSIKQKLERLASSWPYINNVGETFLRIAPGLIVYGDYVQNCKNSIDTLFRCKEEDPRLTTVLEEISMKGAGDLMGLLTKPLNHISEYSLTLKMWVKTVPPTDPDFENLKNAYLAIKKSCIFIQTSNQQAANRARIADVQRKLSFKNQFDLNDSKREFLFEGELMSTEKTMGFTVDKERHFFVFSDLFILTEESGKTYKVRCLFPLKETILEDGKENQFQISHKDEKLQLYTKSKKEKEKFIRLVKEKIEKLSTKHKVFGVSLETVLKREQPADGIPYIVKSCIEYLRQKRDTEGLFRISGGTSEVASLREKFNNLEEISSTPMDLSFASSHSVAAVLKSYFRELPEPILTFSAYDILSELPIGEEERKKHCIEILRKVVNSIPGFNKAILKYLCGFLSSVAQMGETNKMTHSNLAIVFGPNLVYPESESLEAILKIPKMNAVIQFLFENSTEILGN